MRKCVGEVTQVVGEVTQVVGELKQFCWGSDTKIVGEMPQIQSEICPLQKTALVGVSILQFGGMGECGDHYCRLGWEGRPVYYTFSAALQFASTNQ